MHLLRVNSEESGLRLDKFLVVKLPELSRSRLQALISEGHVTCGNKAITNASAKVKTDQEYRVTIPEIIPSHLLPQDIALNVIYEDEHFLVLNKPPGLTVHPGAGNPDGTLVNALLSYCGDSLSGIGGVARPGIVHRIDKDTSGLLVVAKNDAAHLHLSTQLATRTLKRTYLAVVWGVPKNTQGTITGNIGRSPANRQKMTVVKSGGKEATTHYKFLSAECRVQRKEKNSALSTHNSALFALLECELETGRTHQIRVHLTHIGHPLVGDPVYGQTTKQRLAANSYKSLPEKTRAVLLEFKRQALHAKALELIHPVTGKKMRFTCDLPADMQTLVDVLRDK
jgi:23S rRNA pseudouridine1911/1915/1917 synthase